MSEIEIKYLKNIFSEANKVFEREDKFESNKISVVYDISRRKRTNEYSKSRKKQGS